MARLEDSYLQSPGCIFQFTRSLLNLADEFSMSQTVSQRKGTEGEWDEREKERKEERKGHLRS